MLLVSVSDEEGCRAGRGGKGRSKRDDSTVSGTRAAEPARRCPVAEIGESLPSRSRRKVDGPGLNGVEDRRLPVELDTLHDSDKRFLLSCMTTAALLIAICLLTNSSSPGGICCRKSLHVESCCGVSSSSLTLASSAGLMGSDSGTSPSLWPLCGWLRHAVPVLSEPDLLIAVCEINARCGLYGGASLLPLIPENIQHQGACWARNTDVCY